MDKEIGLTMEYDSGIKKNKLLKYTTTCMNLKNSMLSDRSHTQKNTYLMSSIHMKFLYGDS